MKTLAKNLVRASWLSFCLLLCGVALAAETAPATTKTATEPYYPLAVGNQWDYAVHANGNDTEISNRVAKKEVIDGETLYRIDTSAGGQVSASEHLRHAQAGLYRDRFNGLEFSPPIILLKNPPTPGETWETDTKVGDQDFKVKCVIGDFEEVRVPAGKFKALTLNVSTTVGPDTYVSDYWFAPGTGIVQQNLDLAGTKAVLRLKKFSPGVPEDTPVPLSTASEER